MTSQADLSRLLHSLSSRKTPIVRNRGGSPKEIHGSVGTNSLGGTENEAASHVSDVDEKNSSLLESKHKFASNELVLATKKSVYITEM